MPRLPFHFQQFSLQHEAAAHPIGTDGILLGAWAQAPPTAASLLDVGCGCGLIGLMLLQRYPRAQLTALEKHLPSAQEAQHNLAHSPFSERGHIITTNFKHWQAPRRYAVLVSNPPFFAAPFGKRKSSPREQARQNHDMSAEDILYRAPELLLPQGSLQMIVPAPLAPTVQIAARQAGLHLQRCTTVYSLAGKKAERLLLHWRLNAKAPCVCNNLVLRTKTGNFTQDYQRLTGDFHP